MEERRERNSPQQQKKVLTIC